MDPKHGPYRLVQLARDLYLDNGVLYHKSNFNGYPQGVLVLPESMWFDIIDSVHGNEGGFAHLG